MQSRDYCDCGVRLTCLKRTGDNFYCSRCDKTYLLSESTCLVKIEEEINKRAEDDKIQLKKQIENDRIKLKKQIEDNTKFREEQHKVGLPKFYSAVKELYYFAPLSNLVSILKRGILSHNEVRSSNVQVEDYSNAGVQEIRAHLKINLSSGQLTELHEVVNLYFAYDAPAIYHMRKKPGIFLVISPKIVEEESIAYALSDGNMAAGATRFFPELTNIDKIDWSLIRERVPPDSYIADPEIKRKKCAEFLIFPRVDPKFFVKILVRDEVQRMDVQKSISMHNLKIEVECDFTKFSC